MNKFQTSFSKTRRRLCRQAAALLVGSGLALGASAASTDSSPDTYAVLSLVGDKLTTVSLLMTTGSNLDRNHKEVIEMPDKALDKMVLMSAVREFQKTKPRIEPVLLLANDRSIYDAQERLFTNEADAAAPRQALQDLLRRNHATKLILVSRYSAEARIKLKDSHVGHGKLNGLGFASEYRNIKQEHEDDSATHGSGYLAPFAYFRVSVVDVEQMKVLSDATATESVVAILPRTASSMHLWDALTAEQKTQALTQVIDASLAKAMPVALGS